jgi:hypothetical protein
MRSTGTLFIKPDVPNKSIRHPDRLHQRSYGLGLTRCVRLAFVSVQRAQWFRACARGAVPELAYRGFFAYVLAADVALRWVYSLPLLGSFSPDCFFSRNELTLYVQQTR